MTKQAKKSIQIQAVDQSTAIAVEVPPPLVGDVANIEKSLFDL